MGMTFSQAFRDLLKKSGMTQAEYSRRSGFSTAYVSMLASGEIADPKFEKACAIADALDVSLEDFRSLMKD